MRQLLVLLTIAASTSAGAVTGAVVQAASCKDSLAAVTVTNQSEQDITGFSVAINTTLGGKLVRWEHDEDYWPLLTGRGEALLPKQAMTFTKPLDPGTPCTQIDAKVTVAIFRDRTAEVDSDAAQTFEHTVSVRRRIARTLQTAADTLARLPQSDARARLQHLLRKARGDGENSDLDQAYLSGALDLLDKARLGTEDPEQFVKDNVERLRSEASAFFAYSQVRRVQ